MDWQNSADSSTLFCPGAPGTGKTVLSAQAVLHIQRKSNDIRKPVLYVLCDYRRRSDQTIDFLFANIVRQLGFSSWTVFQRIQALCRKCKNENSRPVRKDLEKELEESLRLVGDIYIVIDALDECDKGPRSMLINKLKRLSSKSTIHLLVTARGESDIEALFEGSPRLPIKATVGDIDLYAKERENHFRLGV
jgi:Cdc6-like AAA superfamily ATPase